MPFREVSRMDERTEFVMMASAEGANRRALCRRFAISPMTGYKWLERCSWRALAGLIEKTRRPPHSPPAGIGVDANVPIAGQPGYGV